MNRFAGETLSWEILEGRLEVALHRAPCNEIGSRTLEELETFVVALGEIAALGEARAIVLYSRQPAGFSAGADLRELYARSRATAEAERLPLLRDFLTRIHAALNAIDASPLPTVASVHGVTFGGGFELALVCDVIVADKLARFCLPELRLGIIPGFGAIPRLRRDLGNAVVRDLLLTGRSISAQKAQAVGLVSQVVGEGQALPAARSVAAQIGKFDTRVAGAAKQFVKPIPYDELRQEIDIFCELFTHPAAETGLRKFIESTDVMKYLP